MNTALRKTVIAGNWKMNLTPSQAKELIGEIIPLAKGKDKCEIIVCVPFVDLETAVKAAAGTNIKQDFRTVIKFEAEAVRHCIGSCVQFVNKFFHFVI